MTVAPLQIKFIEIKGLFRQSHPHKILLNLEEHVTILHGRNGVGKTVTLSLVAALLKGNYDKLLHVPFELLRVEFIDGSFLEAEPSASSHSQQDQSGGVGLSPTKSIAASRYSAVGLFLKSTTGRATRDETLLVIRYSIAGAEPVSMPVSGNYSNNVAARLAEVMPGLTRIGEQQWLDSESTEILNVEEVFERATKIPAASRLRALAVFQDERILQLRVPVHFIEAQRLFKIAKVTNLHRETSSITSAVKDIREEISQRIKETDSLYRSTSTRLDNSLPARMFDPDPGMEKLTLNELSRRAEALEIERSRLRAIGLVADTSNFNPSSLSDPQRAMFAVYLKDNEEKLGVFKDLADRSEILLRIINHKFSPKRVKLDKDEGYQAFSADGRPLDLDLLSSGEQHELVLLHNLLFRVEAGALLLIDEPELSLHVTWQSEFLKDLIEIAKTVGFDALVATHSPYIVGERRDLAVQLGAPE